MYVVISIVNITVRTTINSDINFRLNPASKKHGFNFKDQKFPWQHNSTPTGGAAPITRATGSIPRRNWSWCTSRN